MAVHTVIAERSAAVNTQWCTFVTKLSHTVDYEREDEDTFTLVGASTWLGSGSMNVTSAHRKDFSSSSVLRTGQKTPS